MVKRILHVLLIFFPAVASAQIVNIETQRIRNDTIGFDGRIEGNVEMSQNTTFLFSANTKAQVQYKWKRDLLLALGDWRFTVGDGQRFQNDAMGHLRYNHMFLRWLNLEVFGQLQFNELLNVRLRALAGAGPRFKVTPSRPAWDNYRLYVGTLYMFEYEEVSVDDTIHRDHRMSGYLSFTVDPPGTLAFTGTTYYQPLLKNWADFRVSGTYVLGFNFFRRFAFKVEYSFLYDSRPPTGVRSFTFGLKTGLIFKFRP